MSLLQFAERFRSVDHHQSLFLDKLENSYRKAYLLLLDCRTDLKTKNNLSQTSVLENEVITFYGNRYFIRGSLSGSKMPLIGKTIKYT